MKNKTNTWQCGTLTYTKPALVILFFWLFWGDVCYTLMEAVTNPIMLLKFKDLGATNRQIALLATILPNTIYLSFGPVISFKSDRFRSGIGRRIPFLLFSVPFLVAGLAVLAFGDQLGLWVHSHLPISRLSPNQTVMLVFGFLLVVFMFFNTFTTTVFWYLFNDVVPAPLLARFLSWFRIISTISLACYQLFIFPYSQTHATAIFLGAAALYLVGFGLMCLNVREGQYPPPPEYVGGRSGPIAAIKTYAEECHRHRLYWYLWLCTFIGCIGAGIGINSTGFDLYFKQAIGLDLTQIGRINFCLNVSVAVLVAAAGWLADRFQPIRVVLAGLILSWLTVIPASFIWLFWHPAPESVWTFHLPFLQYLPWLSQFTVFNVQRVFLISMIIYVGLAAPVNALTCMWDPPMLMRTFPRSRLGQFCSTNALWRTAGLMLGMFLGGCFLDVITQWVGKERAYYYIPVWINAFNLVGFFFFILFYRTWKQLGGSQSYVAPVSNGDEVTAAPAEEAGGESPLVSPGSPGLLSTDIGGAEFECANGSEQQPAP